jgi:hypothetical protein
MVSFRVKFKLQYLAICLILNWVGAKVYIFAELSTLMVMKWI